jgi:phosphotransferase system  glucose/maltose/N-acetylglucosamine-specific IIC component
MSFAAITLCVASQRVFVVVVVVVVVVYFVINFLIHRRNETQVQLYSS